MRQKHVLKRQSSMKITLNGGKYELDDATIPFQIGFNESIAKKKPAHILVMDITRNSFENNKRRIPYDNCSERTFFDLEPIQYLQLKKPGVHHLVFILFSEVSNRSHKFYMEKSSHSIYNNCLYFDSIEKLELCNQIAFCEMIISVPEEFFAIKPKTGIKKILWRWINSWYSFEPIDQCEYRKRSIFAFTAKPILWLIGFFFRLILVTLWTTFFFVWKIFGLFFGYQPVKFIPYKKKVWYEFLICYPREKFDVLSPGEWSDNYMDGRIEEGYYPFKTLGIGKKRVHIPITLFGIIYYFFMFFCYVISILQYFYADVSLRLNLSSLLSTVMFSLLIALLASNSTLPTLKGNRDWENKWDTYRAEGKKLRKNAFVWIFSILMGVSILLFMATQIPWAEILHLGIKIIFYLIVFLSICISLFFLFKLLVKTTKQFFKNKEKQVKVIQKDKRYIREKKYQEWLLKSFDINNLPNKIDFRAMPEPSNSAHKVIIRFWRTKAKVCKPYAK